MPFLGPCIRAVAFVLLFAHAREATSAEALYWADEILGLQRLDLSNSVVSTVLPNPVIAPENLFLDRDSGKMYWMDVPTFKLQRANLDGSSVEDLVSLDFFPPQQVTVDPEGQKIYWSVFLPTAIRRSNLDGSNVEDVVTQGIVLPRSFAVDSAGGKIYWTEEQGGTIRRADLNGANVEDLVSLGLAIPAGIRLDVADGKIYWTDIGTGRISRAELTGPNIEDLVSRIFKAPRGMAVDQRDEKIYWADEGTGLHRVDFDGTSFETLVRPGLTGLASPQSVALDLEARKMYWIDSGSVPGRGRIRRSNLDGSSAETVVSGSSRLEDIALDLGRGKMYWKEIFPSRILRANLDGSLVEDVFVAGSPMEGLAIDPLMGKIYFGQRKPNSCCPPIGFLRQANLDGSDPIDLASPNWVGAIALDLLARKVYWVFRAGVVGPPNIIQRADLDGTDVENLLLGDLHGITLDLGESPLAGTGLSFDNLAAGDNFLQISPTVPETQARGSVGSVPGVVKDVATDPITGLLYTIDLPSGPRGQRLYRGSPNGPWTALPSRTGISAPGFIWGLAFDAQGTLYGGGNGIYIINKHTGEASLLAGTPGLIFGMAASPSGSGFLSTGLLMLPGTTVPYVALHSPDGALVSDAVFISIDSSGQGRVLFDIAWSKENLLYGIAWPEEAFRSPGGEFHFDLVLMNLTRLNGTPLALMSVGAPLKAVVFGLGGN